MSKPLLVYGTDNGTCRLYAMTAKDYAAWHTKYAMAENEEDWGRLEQDLEAKEIKVTVRDVGYVPDYVVQLSKIYGFEVESI